MYKYTYHIHIIYIHMHVIYIIIVYVLYNWNECADSLLSKLVTNNVITCFFPWSSVNWNCFWSCVSGYSLSSSDLTFVQYTLGMLLLLFRWTSFTWAFYEKLSFRGSLVCLINCISSLIVMLLFLFSSTVQYLYIFLFFFSYCVYRWIY